MMSVLDTFLALLSLDPPGWGGVLLRGAMKTIVIAVGAYAIGTLLGLIGAMAKLNGGGILRTLVTGYVVGVRAVPELILIVALYFAGTQALNRLLQIFGYEGVEVNGLLASILVLGIVQGAYMTEVFRGAVQSISLGQIEAAKAIGMRRWLRFRKVILPAAVPNALPGMSNLWLNVTKDTALIAVVGYQELAMAASAAATSTKYYMLFFFAAGLIYLAITFVSNVFFGYLERVYRVGQKR